MIDLCGIVCQNLGAKVQQKNEIRKKKKEKNHRGARGKQQDRVLHAG